MLSKQIRTLVLSAVIMMFGYTSPALAEEKVWMHAGKIDAIDHTHQQMVINDVSLKLTATTRLFSPDRKAISSADLKGGDLVGVDYKRVPGTGRTLVELQLFRPGTKPRLDKDGG